MRSQLVFAATASVPNRYLLTRLAAKATRKLHRPNTRIQDTANDVLIRFKDVSPVTGLPTVEEQVSDEPVALCFS
ncbi:MAG TPA: hypothetical protein VNW54_12275 [Granulicella sp.]|jgi:hypothetical protein|nr:hypothetical protein [Granulicella sp.]